MGWPPQPHPMKLHVVVVQLIGKLILGMRPYFDPTSTTTSKKNPRRIKKNEDLI